MNEVTQKTFLEHNSDLHEEILKISNKKNKKFYTNTIRDVFLLGMAYAAKKDLESKELATSKKKQSIRIKEVINDNHRFFFQIVEYASSKDPTSIAYLNNIYKTAEKYANSGLISLIEDEEIQREDYPSFVLASLVLD